MSKATDQILLVPGASGWEIWTRTGNSTVPGTRTTAERAGDLTEIPAGDIALLFPVKSVTAVPMQAASTDDALLPDLAALHAERLGLRADPLAGQLTDTFTISKDAETTTLLSVFLRAPGEGDLPPRGPKKFDLSARAFPVVGNAVAVWQEFGRWVFAIHREGNLVYCQATADDAPLPGQPLAREIRFALAQLTMQGISAPPARILVWHENPTGGGESFFGGLPVEFHARPAPVFPDPPSKLLPADVRAARRTAERKRNATLGIAALAVLYAGLLGWFGYGLWKKNQETARLAREARAAAPESERYAAHVARWDELSPAIELKNSPVDIMWRISSSIPAGSGVRLKNADVSATEIKLIGEGPSLPAVNAFNLRLTKHPDLANFTWQTPEATQSQRGWEFTYTGNVAETAQP